MHRVRYQIAQYLVTAVMIVFSLHSWYGPDIWHHLEKGREIFAQESTNPIHTTFFKQPAPAAPAWLFQATVYGLYSLFGLLTTSLFFAVAWWLIILKWFESTYSSHAPRESYLALLAALGTVLCLQLRTEHRPEVISYLLIMLFITELKKADSFTTKMCFRLIVLEILWVNLHGYFIFGIGLVGAKAVETILSNRSKIRKLPRSTFFFPIAMVAATFCRPDALGNWERVLKYRELLRDASISIEEFFPLYSYALVWPLNIYWCILLPAFGYAVYSLLKIRYVFASIISIAGVLISVQTYRSLGIALLFSGPIIGALCTDLENLLNVFSKKAFSRYRLTMVISVSSLSVLIAVFTMTNAYYRWIGTSTIFGPRLDVAETAVPAAAILQQMNFSGAIFCDPNDCGYLKYVLPAVITPGDSYFSNLAMTKELFQKTSNFQGFSELDREMNLKGAVVSTQSKDILLNLLKSTSWKAVAVDTHRMTFVKTDQTFEPDAPSPFANAVMVSTEDLMRPTYSDAMVRWIEVGVSIKDGVLIDQVVTGLISTPQIPSQIIKNLLIATSVLNRRDIRERIKALENKIVVTDPKDEEHIARLWQL